MQTQSQDTTICQTCNHESECAHYQHSQNMGKPIWFCENFDNGSSPQAVENKKIYSEERSLQSSIPDIGLIPGRMKGLCISCENRVSCLFAIQDGGVWHCEEYC